MLPILYLLPIGTNKWEKKEKKNRNQYDEICWLCKIVIVKHKISTAGVSTWKITAFVNIVILLWFDFSFPRENESV